MQVFKYLRIVFKNQWFEHHFVQWKSRCLSKFQKRHVVIETYLDFAQRLKTQHQAVDDPVVISIRKYIMKRWKNEEGIHACLIWRSMFYSGHRIAILSTNNPIIKKTETSSRFVKRWWNSSKVQCCFQSHLQCSQVILNNWMSSTLLI